MAVPCEGCRLSTRFRQAIEVSAKHQQGRPQLRPQAADGLAGQPALPIDSSTIATARGRWARNLRTQPALAGCGLGWPGHPGPPAPPAEATARRPPHAPPSGAAVASRFGAARRGRPTSGGSRRRRAPPPPRPPGLRPRGADPRPSWERAGAPVGEPRSPVSGESAVYRRLGRACPGGGARRPPQPDSDEGPPRSMVGVGRRASIPSRQQGIDSESSARCSWRRQEERRSCSEPS
jgi:hypothetical protein